MNLAVEFMQRLENERSSGIFGALDILVAERSQVRKGHYLALWHNLQHALKRMLSLHDAFGVFAATAREWPQLFRDPTVKFLRSSHPKAYRLQPFDKLDVFLQGLNFDVKTTRQAILRSYLEKELKKCVQGVAGMKNKRLIHAEVQLWAAIRKAEKFAPFHPWRSHQSEDAATPAVVIGVSKLTCRLCHWFFESVDSPRIVIRPSSWNVYHRWALPNLSKDLNIARRLDNELAHELRCVLNGGDFRRTETDTDSEPNSPGILSVSGESSCASSVLNSSEAWSHVGWATSSVESGPDLEKAG